MNERFETHIYYYEDAFGFRHPMVTYRSWDNPRPVIEITMTDSPTPELPDDSDEPIFNSDEVNDEQSWFGDDDDEFDGFDEVDFDGWDEDDE